jgi:predicted RNA-binding Zn ribbon-like protein
MGDVASMMLVGGHPALDFVNTLGGLSDDPNDEYLHDYGDLLAWCVRAGLLTPSEEGRVRVLAGASSAEAARVLGRTLELRIAVDRILRHRLAGRHPAVQDLRLVASAYVEAVDHAELKWGTHGVRW